MLFRSDRDTWLQPPRDQDNRFAHRFDLCYKYAYELMGLNLDDYDRMLRIDWTSTLGIFRTDINKGLIKELESRYKGLYYRLFDFETLSGQWRYFTEHALLSAWYECQGKMDLYQPYYPAVRGLRSGLFPCMAPWDKDIRGLPWIVVKDSKENNNENINTR